MHFTTMLDKFEDACGVDANCEGPAHAFPPSKYPFRLEGCHLPSFSLPLTNIPPLSLFDLPSFLDRRPFNMCVLFDLLFLSLCRSVPESLLGSRLMPGSECCKFPLPALAQK